MAMAKAMVRRAIADQIPFGWVTADAAYGSVNSGFGNAHAETAPLSLQMAVVVLTSVPLLIVYPFMQKHFRTGVLTGAIKG